MNKEENTTDVCITLSGHNSFIELYETDWDIITNKERWFEVMRTDKILETLWFHYVQERHKAN